MAVNMYELYKWTSLPCACCGLSSYIELGFRGGEAHRNKIGVKCKIVRCLGCGHIYPEPMPILKDPNVHYQSVDGFFTNYDSNQQIRNHSSLLRRFEKTLGHKGRILDVGSGRGEMLYAAKNMGWDAQGIEISKEFADFSKNTYGVEVKNLALEDAKYPQLYFDVVTLCAVMEHLYYPKQVLLEINRVLKQSGILWMDAPNEASLYNKIGNLYFKIQGKNWVTHLSPTFPPYHVQGFTKNSIAQLLSDTGFEIKTLKIYSGYALLPYHKIKERIEHYGTWVIGKIAAFLNLGTHMQIEAIKTKSISRSVDK